MIPLFLYNWYQNHQTHVPCHYLEVKIDWLSGWPLIIFLSLKRQGKRPYLKPSFSRLFIFIRIFALFVNTWYTPIQGHSFYRPSTAIAVLMNFLTDSMINIINNDMELSSLYGSLESLQIRNKANKTISIYNTVRLKSQLDGGMRTILHVNTSFWYYFSFNQSFISSLVDAFTKLLFETIPLSNHFWCRYVCFYCRWLFQILCCVIFLCFNSQTTTMVLIHWLFLTK